MTYTEFAQQYPAYLKDVSATTRRAWKHRGFVPTHRLVEAMSVHAFGDAVKAEIAKREYPKVVWSSDVFRVTRIGADFDIRALRPGSMVPITGCMNPLIAEQQQRDAMGELVWVPTDAPKWLLLAL